MGRLDDKVAIVTGAGRGIGRATAVRLAQDGASVVVNDVDSGPAKETTDLIQEWGGRAAVNVDDTVDFRAAERLVQTAVELWGGPDILVNNAGITRDRMFHTMDEAAFDFALDVNLKTGVHVSRAAAPYLRAAAKREIAEQGSVAYNRKIAFTSSAAALTGNPAQANYTAAKGAVISLAKTLAGELGPFGINVNAVAPGFVETRLTAPKEAPEAGEAQEGDGLGVPAQARDAAVDMIALGRAGRPEDIANVHAFLASPDSDFISGATIPVTGGQFGGMSG